MYPSHVVTTGDDVVLPFKLTDYEFVDWVSRLQDKVNSEVENLPSGFTLLGDGTLR